MKRNILDYFGVMCAKSFSAGLNIFHTIKIIRNAPLAQPDRADRATLKNAYEYAEKRVQEIGFHESASEE